MLSGGMWVCTEVNTGVYLWCIYIYIYVEGGIFRLYIISRVILFSDTSSVQQSWVLTKALRLMI